LALFLLYHGDSSSGSGYVELTDTDGDDDLVLDVTTNDFGFEITEEFGEVDVTGHLDFSDGDYDVAGITVAGGFGSVYIGDDGTGVLAADLTDNLENNSEVFYTDDSADVIDYSLPLEGPFSANVFVGISDLDREATATDPAYTDDVDLDFVGAYGSFSTAGATVALGYTTADEDGSFYDSIVDLAVSYETGPISVAVGYQDVDNEFIDDNVISATATYTAGAFSITPYYEEFGDFTVTALNLTYTFTDNFYAFFETADYSDELQNIALLDEEDFIYDNSEIGLVLNF